MTRKTANRGGLGNHPAGVTETRTATPCCLLAANYLRDGRRWWASFAAGTLLFWLTMAMGHAEQIDSGWVVARPLALVPETQSADPTTRIVIDHVLGQMRLTRVPGESAESTPQPAPATLDGTPRIAKQSSGGADGWRPASEPTGPVLFSGGPSGSEQHAEAGETRGAETGAGPVIEFAPDRGAAGAKVPEEGALDRSATRHIESNLDGSENDELTSGEGLSSRSTDTARHDPPRESAEISNADEMTADVPAGKRSEPAELSSGPRDAVDAAKESAAETGSGLPVTISDTPITVVPQPEPKPLPPLPRQLMNLRGKVRGVLKGYSRKSLNSRENDPWQSMHAMLAYELDSRIHQDGPSGNPITMVGWLCYNRPCKGLTLLYVSPEGDLRVKLGPGLQGHQGQLLAILAQCRVSPEYPIRVGSQPFTIRDLIEAEKKTCYPKTELSFKLIAFTQYLDLNDRWVNDEGLEWDIPRLIREEMAQPIRSNSTACGGTHRLGGLSLAVKARQQRGEPLDGEYLRAAEFVENYEQLAFRLQNRDGSLSTKWFQGRGDEDDSDRRIKTTGHILEWLVYTQSDDELRAQRMVSAVNYLATLLSTEYDHEWEMGPRSHAIHALLRYDERVFRPYDTVESIASPKSKSSQPAARRTRSRTSQR